MEEKFTKEELAALKVAELKDIATKYELEIKGLKKADLVDLLDSYFNDIEEDVQDEESVCESCQLVQEPEERQEDSDREERNEERPEVIEEKQEVSKEGRFQPSSLFTISGVKVIYKDSKLTKPITKISGLVKVLDEFDKVRKVRCTISGLGPIVGYISK